MKYFIQDNFLPLEQFEEIKKTFNVEEIFDYCNNSKNKEYDYIENGNYSFPAENAKNADNVIFNIFNDSFFKKITKKLSKYNLQHQFSYGNFHYDIQGSSLPIHNDIKEYRWLITSQLYIDGNENDGVKLIDTNNATILIHLKPNTFYSMWADSYSWHYVNPIIQNKKSLLLRWGQKKINTVVNKNKENNIAILIVGDFQYNDDKIKIGQRLQNLTEAWLFNQGYTNIYNTNWKDSKSYASILFYLLESYEKICLVPAGYLGEGNLYEKPCVYITTDFVEYNLLKRILDVSSPEIFKAEKSKMKYIIETIFGNPKIEILAQAEKVLYNTKLIQNFSSFDLKKIT